MKWEKRISLLAFVSGVIVMNLLGDVVYTNQSILSRYNLVRFTFEEINFQEYLLEILLLRFRTVAGLWILSKLLPKKIVAVGFMIMIGFMFGSLIAIFIIVNGIWGILLFLGVIFPHILCYAGAFWVWCREHKESVGGRRLSEDYLLLLLVAILMVIGCWLEAYLSPVLVENIIKI